MRKEKLSEIMEHIDDGIIEEAVSYEKKSNNKKGYSAVKRFGLVAACFLLAVVIGTATNTFEFPFFGDQNVPKSENSDTPSMTDASQTAESVIETPPATAPAADDHKQPAKIDPPAEITQAPPATEPAVDLKPPAEENGVVIERDYKGILAEQSATIWPWEYKTESEKFTDIKANGTEYISRGRIISDELVGDLICTGDASGYDIYTETEYMAEYEVYEIDNVSHEYRVAVKMTDGYYVYGRSNVPEPSCFGDMIDAYGLEHTLSFNRFSEMNGYTDDGYYVLNDGADIMPYLLNCRDAEYIGDIDHFAIGSYLSFTVTSEKLGIYKKVMYITADGYLWTNLNEYGYAFNVGKEAASEIIAYAKENSSPAEAEPYQYWLVGTLTEIGDGFVMIDDTSVCVNENDGRIFKVLTEDLRVRRCFEFGRDCPIVGDTVAVIFDGPIEVFGESTVKGAVSAAVAFISDEGDAFIQE